METSDDSPSDSDVLKQRRAALRLFVDDIASHIQTLDLPTTYLEAERAARAITVHDRAIETLPLSLSEALPENDNSDEATSGDTATALKPIRRHLRRFADRVMEAATLITKPDSFLEGERAGRYALAADRMLSQLYEAPSAKAISVTRFADDLDDADEDGAGEDESPYPSGKNWKLDLQNRVDRITNGCARRCGIWPDGSPCIEGAPLPAHPFNEADRDVLLRVNAPDANPLDRDRLTALILAGRANAVSRALARKDGRWPDHSPFSESDPDYYAISAHFDHDVLHQPPPDLPPDYKETPNDIGFPAWLVRKVKPPP